MRLLETTLYSALSLLKFLWPAWLVFAVLAIASKREAIVEAVRGVRGEFATNLGLTFLNTLVISPLFVVPTKAVHDLLPHSDTLVEFWLGVPIWLTLLFALLAIEFAAYWRHRIEHHRWLWPIHATHHADEAIHWLTVYRKHPLSKVLAGIIDVAVLLMLGLPLWALGTAMLLRTWWGFFVHADVNWTLGIFGEVLISPAAHRLHHIRDEKLMGTNYGNTFTLWDRLFGTYMDPKPYLGCEIGIAEGTRGFFGELARPFEKRYWFSSSVDGQRVASDNSTAGLQD